MSAYDINQKLLCISSVTAASGSIGTSTVDLSTILARNPDQQTVLITNNHASNIVYVGFISTMTALGSYSYKLTAGASQALQVGPDFALYVVASGASTPITVVRGA
jgi:hypothetical protein